MWNKPIDNWRSKEQGRHRITIASGLYKGVERTLAAGKYSIGRSPNCDLVFEDPSLEDRALSLTVKPRQIIATAEQGLGIETSKETTLIEAGKKFELPVPGKIHFGDLTLEISRDGHNESLGSWTARNPVSTGLLSLMVLTVLAFFWLKFDSAPTRSAVLDEKNRIGQIISNLGMEDQLDVAHSENGWRIRGVAASRAEVNQLSRALRDDEIKATLDIVDDRSVERSARAITSAFPGRLKVSSQKPGAIRVTGFVSEEKARNQLRQALSDDVRGLQSLQFDVVSNKQIIDQSKQWLNNTSIGKSVDFEATPSGILASGSLLPGQGDTLNEFRIWYDQRFGQYMPLSVDIDQKENKLPEIEIRSIWAGDNPYVIASNGARYALGAVMPGGWRIEEIQSDRLLIKQDETLLELRM